MIRLRSFAAYAYAVFALLPSIALTGDWEGTDIGLTGDWQQIGFAFTHSSPVLHPYWIRVKYGWTKAHLVSSLKSVYCQSRVGYGAGTGRFEAGLQCLLRFPVNSSQPGFGEESGRGRYKGWSWVFENLSALWNSKISSSKSKTGTRIWLTGTDEQELLMHHHFTRHFYMLDLFLCRIA